MLARISVLSIICCTVLYLGVFVTHAEGFVLIFVDGFESGDATAWSSAPEICGNDIDDDRDGYFDCDTHPVCQEEICDNNIDDDGDGHIDCDDEDCDGDPACQ